MKWIMALLVIVALFVAGTRIVPVYLRAYDFRDDMRTQARFAETDRKSPATIREELYVKARELDLPLRREQIQVTKVPGGVTIAARFTVRVDLTLFQHDLNFNFEVKR